MPAFTAPGANNVLTQSTATVGTSAVEVLKGNKARVAYRIYTDSLNKDYLYLGYDDSVTTSNTYVRIGRDQKFEDSGRDVCYKGPVYLISGIAAQSCIVEEILLIGG